jgi:hypothetical protein
MMITSRGKTALDDETVGNLDWAEIENVDLIIRPYNWVLHEGTKAENRGVKAYVSSMYVTIVEDEFEAKYHDAPENDVILPGDYKCPDCGKCDGKGSCRYD